MKSLCGGECFLLKQNALVCLKKNTAWFCSYQQWCLVSMTCDMNIIKCNCWGEYFSIKCYSNMRVFLIESNLTHTYLFFIFLVTLCCIPVMVYTWVNMNPTLGTRKIKMSAKCHFFNIISMCYTKKKNTPPSSRKELP